MTRLLPLILLLCCLVGCVSKQKPIITIGKSDSSIYRTPNMYEVILFDSSGMHIGAYKKVGGDWVVNDTAVALKVSLNTLEENWKEGMPVYIIDGDTIHLTHGDTIRATRCREIQSDFKTVSTDTISDPKYYANKTNNLK